MVMRSDEVRSLESACVELGTQQAVKQVCDILYTVELALMIFRHKLQPDHQAHTQLMTYEDISTGREFARSVVESIAEDIPINFRKVVQMVTEGDECVAVNDDWVLDQIKERTYQFIGGAV